MDKKLLQQHALPTVEAYGYTTETLLRALDMDEFLPGPLGPPAKLLGGPRVSRRAIRAGRCLHPPPPPPPPPPPTAARMCVITVVVILRMCILVSNTSLVYYACKLLSGSAAASVRR